MNDKYVQEQREAARRHLDDLLDEWCEEMGTTRHEVHVWHEKRQALRKMIVRINASVVRAADNLRAVNAGFAWAARAADELRVNWPHA